MPPPAFSIITERTFSSMHLDHTDCHACGTQRYNCEELNLLDNKTDMEIEEADNESILS